MSGKTITLILIGLALASAKVFYKSGGPMGSKSSPTSDERFRFSDSDELIEAVQDNWIARGNRADALIEIDGDHLILTREGNSERIRMTKVTANEIWFTESKYEMLVFHYSRDMIRLFYIPPGMRTTLIDYFDRDGE